MALSPSVVSERSRMAPLQAKQVSEVLEKALPRGRVALKRASRSRMRNRRGSSIVGTHDAPLNKVCASDRRKRRDILGLTEELSG